MNSNGTEAAYGGSIVYRSADYENPTVREQVLRLYRDIFRIDFAEGYRKWFCDWPAPAGIVALEENLGEVIGHFAAVRFYAVVGGKNTPFRMSMGFMTNPDFRGKGVASNLYACLRAEILRRNDAAFIIGFPNDVSYHMHVRRMDYAPLADFRFVVLPDCGAKGTYRPLRDFESDARTETADLNRLLHDGAYMRWRYREEQYEKWLSAEGNLFISTKFRDKADILYWSSAVSEKELLDFAAFLYRDASVSRVTTWDSLPFLKRYPSEERRYHMCVNCLDASESDRAAILRDWKFFMGDCELF